jgi:hypothetical protein
MGRWLKRIISFKWVAEFLGAVLSAPWSVLLSAGAGICAAIWAWLSQQPLVWVAIAALATFTLLIWMWNGITWARNQKRPSKARISFDYAYGLSLENITLGLDDDGRGDAALQFGLNLRNATSGPIKYYVEEFDVIVNDRTAALPLFKNRGGPLPRDARTIFFYPPFSKSVLEECRPRAAGLIKFTITYGHPEAGYSRRAKKRLSFNARLDNKVGLAYVVEDESDEAIAE